MAKLDRAVYSQRQLEAVMEDFWFNHFNVFADKGADRWLLTSYVRDTIRPHTMGKFSGSCCWPPRRVRRCSSFSTTG